MTLPLPYPSSALIMDEQAPFLKQSTFQGSMACAACDSWHMARGTSCMAQHSDSLHIIREERLRLAATQL